MRAIVAICFVLARPVPAVAERHVVASGETLERVAHVYGCAVSAVLRANRLSTTLVKAGTIVEIPRCGAKQRADDAGERAQRALAAIEGTTKSAADRAAASTGEPWNGRLRGGERLDAGPGYVVRRPERAFGAPHVVEHVRGAIATVRALYPDVHALAIGDLSARGGGKLGDHHSHQTGLDVDLGFYFDTVPDGYPARFVTAAAGELDLQATWALVTAFARTADLRDGVQMIFLDHDVQARLYRWARARGTPDDQLAVLLQYPRDRDTPVGLVRHWPRHADHLHVRFKPAR